MAAGLFIWGQHYITGVDEVDHQHEEIGILLNELYEARQSRASRPRLQEALDSLTEAVVEHFNTEEALMLEKRYDEYESHKRQHDELVSRVTVMRRQFESGRTDVLDEGLEVLKEWLRDHLITSDRRMGRYLRP